jgi:hypothetical protein
MHIHGATVDEIPRHYQRHTMGVSAAIGRLLRRVPWTVACYSEQHP